MNLLRDGAPEDQGFNGELVFKADAGIADPAVKARIDTMIDDLTSATGVARIDSPYDPARGPRQVAPPKPGDVAKIAYVAVNFDKDITTIPKDTKARIEKAVAAARTDGLQIEEGGAAFGGEPEMGHSEIYGIIAAVIILIVAFGSLLAMGLPILMALFGLGVGIMGVEILAHLIPIPNIAVQLVSMIGLGVGIDYS